MQRKGNIMERTFKHEDIEQILAEADDLLKQIDPEIKEYMEEEKRAQIEQQARSLRELKSEVQDKIGKEKPASGAAYSEGVHEAIVDIVKAMKGLSRYFS